MTDQNRVNWLLQALFTASSTATFTPGTGGGSALVISPPYHLRLMTTAGSNTVNGTELAGTGGYLQGSVPSNSLGTTFCAAPSGGIMSNSNLVSWNATGTWSTVNGIEIWDAAGTPLRWLQGAITAITGVVNGDTVSFAVSSISLNASQWLGQVRWYKSNN
jgi:hypothetical protein